MLALSVPKLSKRAVVRAVCAVVAVVLAEFVVALWVAGAVVALELAKFALEPDGGAVFVVVVELGGEALELADSVVDLF